MSIRIFSRSLSPLHLHRRAACAFVSGISTAVKNVTSERASKTLGAARRRQREDHAGTKTLSNEELAEYYETYDKRVSGFCEVGLGEMLSTLNSVQDDTGDIIEIGVFHGKSFLPLTFLRDGAERLIAIDCFGKQEHNLDQSGVGSYEMLTKHVKRAHGLEALPSWLTIISADSMTLSAVDITDNARIFSIDGSHTAEATFADLLLADECLGDDGVIILDDCFNCDWPGVVSGLSQYLSESDRDCSTSLVPFAIGFNKVFLSRKARHSKYLSAFESGGRKTATFFKSEVSVFKHGWIATFIANDG
jgi:hypothetical protein